MGWKTYLVMYFGTGNGSATDVAKKLEAIGFKTQFGSVDFVYDWPQQPTKEQVLAIADRIIRDLKGTGAVFNLDTHD